MTKRNCWYALQRLLFLAIASALLMPAQAQKQEYKVVLLHDRVPNIYSDSRATAIFKNQVVGAVTNKQRPFTVHAFLWNLDNNTVQDLHAVLAGSLEVSIPSEISDDYILFVGQRLRGQSAIPIIWDRRTNAPIDLVQRFDSTAVSCVGNLLVGTERYPPSVVDRVLQGIQNGVTSLFQGHPVSIQRLPTTRSRAMVWNQVNRKKVNIDNWMPHDYASSDACDTSGNFVVGYADYKAGVKTTPGTHAILWDLAAHTATDLHDWFQASSGNSWAYSIWGQFVVGHAEGVGTATYHSHALVWDLGNRKAADLHLLLGKGYSYSMAKKIIRMRAVGGASGHLTYYQNNAVLWDLANQTAVNLHREYLIGIGFKDSFATAVDSDGVIVGAGTRNGKQQAWALVPLVPSPRISKPLPTVTVGETPDGGWLMLGVVIILPIMLLILWGRHYALRKATTASSGKQTTGRK